MRHKVFSAGKTKFTDDFWTAMSNLRDGQDIFRSPFFSPEFFRVVSSVRDDVNLFVGESSSGLQYYCPLHLSRIGTARGIGASFSDRNGVVTHPDIDFDIVNLCQAQNIQKFISNGFTTKSLLNTHNFKTVRNNETHLRGDFGIYYEKQCRKYSSHFKRLRRLRRKLDKDFTEVEFRFDDRRDTTYDALMNMKREQFYKSGRHDVLRPEWVQNMFSELRNLNDDSLRLRLSSLFLDGDLVAAELNMQSQQTLHGWVVAFDTKYRKYSPGNLLTQFILESMTDYGLDYYDSGVGGDHYKKYVTNITTPLAAGSVFSNQDTLAPKRIMGSVWGLTENTAPESLAQILRRTRRRSEQILATETDNLSRLRGYFEALNVEI